MHPSIANQQKKRSLRVSEVFYSIEGEGPLTGVPTLFVRTYGCNFTCSGFSNPSLARVIPIHINKLDDFVPTVGCDSIYSWHPEYKHLTKTYLTDDLAHHIVQQLPGQSIVNPKSKTSPVLSLTGGEPTLHSRSIIELLREPEMQGFDKLLIETNAAVTLSEDFIVGLNAWLGGGHRMLLWANSPKLALSGEMRKDAIRPDIILSQMKVAHSVQYFKFVSDGTAESFAEIDSVIEEYNAFLRPLGKSVCHDSIYVMPMGATLEEQDMVQLQVAQRCMDSGYNFCSRVHVTVFKNSVGT